MWRQKGRDRGVACKKMMAEKPDQLLQPVREKRAELDSHPDMVREIYGKRK
jgi:tryptophanyl-tRNA synthetase